MLREDFQKDGKYFVDFHSAGLRVLPVFTYDLKTITTFSFCAFKIKI